MSSSLRRVLGNETLPDVLSAQRDRIMGQIRDQVNTEMRGFGISVEDVRIRRADLPPENTAAMLSRMQSERQRIAAQARAEGAAAAQPRSAPTPTASAPCCWPNAKAQADKLRGEGEAKAIAIYAAAFGRTRISSASGGPCRPIAARSRRGRRIWCCRRTTRS